MSEVKAFIDTNVLLYLMSADTQKADRAEVILRNGGLISVQVLNELTNVARRKLAMSWPDVNEFIGLIQSVCLVERLTLETHDRGRQLAERYRLSVYDAMILSSALIAGCDILYSEDMQHGLLIDQQVQIQNPFSA
jgi:predicted nucleic acid-binding protein